jgi:hypothetical protein
MPADRVVPREKEGQAGRGMMVKGSGRNRHTHGLTPACRTEPGHEMAGIAARYLCHGADEVR